MKRLNLGPLWIRAVEAHFRVFINIGLVSEFLFFAVTNNKKILLKQGEMGGDTVCPKSPELGWLPALQ